MAGCTTSIECPKCHKCFISRVRWGEDIVKHCPECNRGFVVDQAKLTKELRKLNIDSEISVME